ncbi:MAG: Helix-turn-helix protein [Pseudonocardiales bacterium]|nr:Helix-turn-helix protein [Pseudonocardiales bacterium]
MRTSTTVWSVEAGNRLGDHLRARRELLTPIAAGLPGGGHRRVPGLRREEVAMLAGISVDYYLRLEQGRDQHPSEQVLDGIAVALQLDGEARAYLHALARPAPAGRRRHRRPERVSESVHQLIDSWTLTPAYVQGRYLDTLAANAIATALSPFHAPGVNALRAAFLEPEMREFYRDWDEVTARVVPYLRSIAGPDVDDPRLTELVGELSVRSERFRTLWARHDVLLKTSGTSHIMHPLVGPLDLHYEKFGLPGTDRQMLITYHAEPASESHEKLQLLSATITAAEPEPRPLGRGRTRSTPSQPVPNRPLPIRPVPRVQ